MKEDEKTEFFELMDKLYCAFLTEPPNESFWKHKKNVYFECLGKDFSLEELKDKVRKIIAGNSSFPTIADFYNRTDFFNKILKQ